MTAYYARLDEFTFLSANRESCERTKVDDPRITKIGWTRCLTLGVRTPRATPALKIGAEAARKYG